MESEAVPAAALTDSPGQALIRGFHRIDAWLFSLRLRNFALLVIGVAVLQNGLWPAPHTPILCQLSSDLSRQMTRDHPSYDFFYSGPLELVVAHFVGVNHSILAFALFHLGLTLAAILGLTFLMWKRFGDTVARLFLLTFVATPLSTDLFTWLGVSDVYVFVLSTVLVVISGSRWVFPLAVLLGWAHFEQGAVIAAGLAGWRFFHQARTRQPLSAAVGYAVALVGGVVVAHACADGYYAAHGFHFFNSRLSLVSSFSSKFPPADLRHFQSLVFSFHGCYWLVIVASMVSLWTRDRPWVFVILTAHVMAATVAFLVIDETRDFSVIIWPLLVLLLRPDAVRLPGQREWVVAAFLCSLVVPHLIFWGGYMHSGALFYDGDALLRSMFPDGIKDVPELLLSPLR